MTIKQHGGVFGRNPSFNEVEVGDGALKLYRDASNNAVIEEFAAGYLKLVGAGSIQLFSNTGELLAKFVANGQNELYYNNLSRFKTTTTGVEVTDGDLKFADGHGIDFSATSGTGTSELFDDYEEGTFTPTVTDGSVEASYGGRLGRYTKIGRAVHIELYFININTSGLTAGNNIVVGGLPFPHVTQSFNKAILNVQAHTLASTNGAVSAALASAATTMTLIDGTSTQIKDALTVAALTSGTSDLFISGTYEAA